VYRYAYRKYGDAEKARKFTARFPAEVDRDMERDFKKQCGEWTEAIAQALTHCLGKPRFQALKRGKRQRVRRWDWKDTAFLLDARDGEFVILRIEPAARADRADAGKRVSDADIKKKIAGNVLRINNGDVRLKNIPMVDQGLKGYCAVATAERILRYYGIRVDSHELAQIAATDKVRGTSWGSMMQAIEKVANRNHRSLRFIGKQPSARTVQRYIDKGIPLIWGLFATREMEMAVRRRAADRYRMTDPADWKKRLREEFRATRRIRPNRTRGHARLIVGYNRATGEIAYSDSWGQSAPVWIADKEAQILSFDRTCLAAVLP
jgi:hypothetical protein